MDEKLKKQQTTKIQKLLDAAQQKLDSASKSKAPKSTINHLKQRVTALEGQLAKWGVKPGAKKVVGSEGEQAKENTTEPSGKKGKTQKR